MYISSKPKYFPCQWNGKMPTGKPQRVALHRR